ncbi:hypothetical protein B0J12DRAFT_725947 [Macrophomina phaseolina]|uniref:Uncharacterized protein n=1 Tax=Macrophomina phaseolina TaxID=35725 RepID=A0ABQ8GL66_9PEZI|nr:hypothetical protein B0J12DRAFT_725947 [Macrophomina phaseolina]
MLPRRMTFPRCAVCSALQALGHAAPRIDQRSSTPRLPRMRGARGEAGVEGADSSSSKRDSWPGAARRPRRSNPKGAISEPPRPSRNMRMTTPLLGSLMSGSSSQRLQAACSSRLLARRACRHDSHATPLSMNEDVGADPRLPQPWAL